MKLASNAQQPETSEAGTTDVTPAVAAALAEGAESFDVTTSARAVAVAELRRLVAAWRRHEPGARLGEDPEELHQLRRAFRSLFLGDGEFGHRIERVASTFADDPLVQKIVAFVRAGGKRTLVHP